MIPCVKKIFTVFYVNLLQHSMFCVSTFCPVDIFHFNVLLANPSLELPTVTSDYPLTGIVLDCGGPTISLQYTVSLVQWLNRLLPIWGQQFTSRGCTHSHNGTRFLLLALTSYIGDPDMIDHWPHPRRRADNGKIHWALHQRCEKPAVITHTFPWFHFTPCRSPPRNTVTG
jgi:hypothetical protein